MRELSITVDALAPGARVLAPLGISSPHGRVMDLRVEGGAVTTIARDAELDLAAASITAGGGPLTIRHRVDDTPAPYPEAAFAPRRNRWTAASDALAEASRAIANAAGGGAAGIEALAAEAESRFRYTHPNVRFTEGHDDVPYLSCGLTEGSCTDINTYLVASLRAAGYEAAYVFGYFFPAERAGRTRDMHCWVVTRHDGALLEWDIAHHLKAGLGPTRPAPNPRAGERIALGHSMGHLYPVEGETATLRYLPEPMTIENGGRRFTDRLTIEIDPPGGLGAGAKAGAAPTRAPSNTATHTPTHTTTHTATRTTAPA